MKASSMLMPEEERLKCKSPAGIRFTRQDFCRLLYLPNYIEGCFHPKIEKTGRQEKNATMW
jgi:hypothetical protein